MKGLAPVQSKTGRTNAPEQVLRLVNAARRDSDLTPLRMEPLLSKVAHHRAADMAANDYFSHRGWEAALRRFKVSSRRAVGENIAFGQDSADEVFEDWMNSMSHRENILRPPFRAIGIARVEDIWVQIFGGR